MKSLLLLLVSLIALTASLSGLLMVTNPDGDLLNLSPSLLEETPFNNFRVPGLLLMVVVGGVNLVAVYKLIDRHPNRYDWALAGGAAVIGWITVQVILIHTLHWLNIVYIVIALIIILTAYQLKGKWLA